MKEPKYKVGDLVSVERWDKYERPPNKIGSPGTIRFGETAQCESGFMYSVSGVTGKTLYCDENWLLPWEGGPK